ncbi:MAG: hybrid sensor histidine kinase/response regulator [Bacteroidota bacterium]|nr:hybrid sensor histidine kinase/response regulator [Bacteroidota bacterium]
MSKNKKITVLYVDDRKENLAGFRACFRRNFDVLIAESPSEGLRILSEKKVHVIVADYKMPEMSGVEFFESLVIDYPEPLRILLTGHADITGVIDAINRGEVFRFITKPWNEHELKMAIQNAYEMYRTRSLLKETNEELKKSYSELDRFVYSASHDLRAPLMSILGIIEVARSEKENIDLYLDLIQRSVDRLDIFIKNIIDYHRNAKSSGQTDEINFEEIIEETIETFRFYQDTRKVNFKIRVEQKEVFRTDAVRLKIILNNLISNAIKYQQPNNDRQQIRIDIDTDSEKAVIQIEDNGIGIAEDHLNNIFHMFYRATTENTGAGIGLYIVKEVLTKLDADIKVQSVIGQGSTFTMTIPNKPIEIPEKANTAHGTGLAPHETGSAMQTRLAFSTDAATFCGTAAL